MNHLLRPQSVQSNCKYLWKYNFRSAVSRIVSLGKVNGWQLSKPTLQKKLSYKIHNYLLVDSYYLISDDCINMLECGKVEVAGGMTRSPRHRLVWNGPHTPGQGTPASCPVPCSPPRRHATLIAALQQLICSINCNEWCSLGPAARPAISSDNKISSHCIAAAPLQTL